ncbi:MAG: methionyl-tRNA formyltransferase [Magnetococcales bacterium]|nr:methionyl-tRNA formyltransferase [Magnetococcales bacterium]
MEKWRIVFMGTPDFAVPALRALLNSNIPVVGILTQPDKPVGRGLAVQASPVKRTGLEHAIPVFQPERLRSPGAVTTLKTWAPDLVVVVAYGQILSPEVLSMPARGCINVHASLLPRWRGAAPIQRALLAGDAQSGVTIMQMEAGLDTGPILRMRAEPITPTTTGGSLHDALAQSGADLLLETIRDMQTGKVSPQPQPDTGVTYAAKLTRADGLIDWRRRSVEVDRQIRALHPWPGAYTHLHGRVVKVLTCRPVARSEGGEPGKVVAIREDGLEVVCGEGNLVLTGLQTEGRRRMQGAEWARGMSGQLLFGSHRP